MQRRADAVADELAHHREALRLDVLLHRVADVRQMAAGAHLLDRQLERLAGHLEQPAGLARHLADREGARRVAVVALVEDAAVDADDVALDQRLLGRDAVHDDVVDRGAQGRRIAAVVEEGRHPAGGADRLLGVAVELGGGDAGRDALLDAVQHPVDDAVGLVHQLDLAAGLEHHQTLTPRASRMPSVTSEIGRLPSTGRNRPSRP